MENSIDSMTALFAIFIQTSGIFIALVFVLASYRMGILRELLIGFGAAVLNRYHNTNEYYGFLEVMERGFKDRRNLKPYSTFLEEVNKPSQLNKLEDFLLRFIRAKIQVDEEKHKPYSKFIERLRGSIALKEIYGIEEILIRFTAAEQEVSKDPGSTGFTKSLMPLFIETKKHYKFIRNLAGGIILLFMNVIGASLCSIICLKNLIISCSVMIIIGIFLIIVLMWLALIKKVGQETYKKDTVKELLKDNFEIKRLYQ